MNRSTIATGVILLAALVSSLVQIHLVNAYLQGFQVTVFGLFMTLHPVAKLILIQIIIFAAPLLILALIRLAQSPSPNTKRGLDIALWVLSGLILFLGLFNVFFSELATYQAIQEVGPVSFAITAPNRLEWLFVLSYALWPIAIALGLQQLAFRRKV